jgi:uncharacterized membrane protein
MKGGNFITRLLLFFAITFVVQYLFIAFIPNIVFAIAKKRSEKPLNTVIHAPKTDAKLRRVVLPNPDFVYSACFFDISENDIVISGEFPDTSQYCSLAFYEDNVQPFYVMNNLQGFKPKYRVRLSHVGRVNGTIKSVSKKGAVLMRILVTDSLQASMSKKIQQKFKVDVVSQNE